MDWHSLRAARPLVAAGLQNDLGGFCRAAWPHLHRGTRLSWTWSHDLMCEYLTQVKRREITRLIINCPPRFAKSSIAGILFPVWSWLSSPEMTFLCASYEIDLASSHNLDRRRLIACEWFQGLFRDRFRLNSDRSLVQEFTNANGGAMLAASVNSRAMGRGGDIVVIDDPLSADSAYSDVLRGEVNEWFMHMLPQRLNDPATSPIVLIQQRLHQDDPTGFLLEREPGEWTLLRLPLVAEEDERWVFPVSGRVVIRKEGETLDPKRFTKKVVEARQRNRIVWASQFQQRPAPLEGNMVRTADLRYFGGRDPRTGERDAEMPEAFDQKLISVDCSFKDKATSDFVAILTIGVSGSRRYLLNAVNSHLDLDATEDEIRRQHALFGPINAVLIEDKANGSAVIGHLKDHISGVIAVNPEGGKVARLVAVSPEFQAHDWVLDRNAAWCDPFIEQLTMFPNAKNDDMVDACTQAGIWLQSNSSQLGLIDWLKTRGSDWLKPRETKTVQLTRRPDGCVEATKSASSPAAGPCGCDPQLHVPIAYGKRCNQCGSQWMDGSYRPPKRWSRRDMPRSA